MASLVSYAGSRGTGSPEPPLLLRQSHCRVASRMPASAAAARQVLYSDEGGRLWRTQILEIRNPDEPPKIFCWERAATWGRAEYR
jgi:hypothetical protein